MRQSICHWQLPPSIPPASSGPAKPAPVSWSLLQRVAGAGAARPLRYCQLAGPTPSIRFPRPSSPAALGPFRAGGWLGLPACLVPSFCLSVGRGDVAPTIARASSGTPGGALARIRPGFALLAVLQSLSPPLRAASVRASLPRGPSPCALRRPSSRRGPAAPLARGRRCRARPGPAHFGSSADPPGLPAPLRREGTNN